MFAGTLYQAAAASLPPPSVSSRFVPFSLALPFSTILPALKPDPRLTTVVAVAVVTVSVVEPAMLPEVAEIVVLWPAVTADVSPAELIVAAVVFDEAQVTEEVMFCVLLSEYVPVAVNGTVVPACADGFVGVTAMDVKVGGVDVPLAV